MTKGVSVVRSRILVIGLLSATLAAAGAQVVDAAIPAPLGTGLGGEVFNGDVFTTNKHCDLKETSTFDFTSEGVATGVYPGTYSESGTLGVGPQNLLGEPLGIRRGFSAGTVLSLDATFTIDSPLAQVSGHKTIITVVPENVAACAILDTYDFGGVPPTMGLGVCTNVDYEDAYLPLIDYDATIVTPTATYSDSGAAVARFEQLAAFCPALQGPNGEGGEVGPGGVFEEAFFLSNPADTPGRATGGGMIPGAGGQSTVTFGFNAMSTGATFKGNCTVVDHALGKQVKCLDVTSYVQSGNHGTFRGNGTVNGTPTGYRIDVIDNGEPGFGDTFLIATASGYSAGGILTGGNVQVS
jgi:hypothetical protein